MEKNNDLISVIEDLLEADMTEPKKVRNPQNKMGEEEEQVKEAQDKTDKAIAANKLGDTAKPKADNQSDNSAEVVGSNKGAALDGGGDKDVGKMGSKEKGNPSAAADNSKEVLGSEKGAAMDAGGDKDVGKMGSKEKGNPSDASAAAEPNKGPHNQAMDEDLHDGDDGSDDVVSEDDGTVEEGQDTKIVKNANDEQLPDDEKESMKNMKAEEADLDWDWEKIDSLSEEEFNELVGQLSEDELKEFNKRFESLVESEEESDEEVVEESEEPVEEGHGEDDDDDDDDDDDEDKEKMDEAAEKYDEELSEEDAAHICESKYHVCAVVVEHEDWGIGKPLIGRHAEPDADGNVAWYDVEFEHGIEEKVEIEGLNILDEMNHGKPKKKKMGEEDEDKDDDDDDDDDKEMDEALDPVGKADADIDNDGDTDSSDKYLHNRRKAIKKAMGKADEEVEVGEATGEKLEKAPTKSSNEPMRPDQEKGDNEPETKGGTPDQGPHNQSKDANETPTKANPKGAVKEEDELTEDLDEDFKEKAKVIFETAVNEKANMIREEFEKQYEEKLNEEVDSLNTKVNEYMDYVVNEWMEENALEIKYSLRTEIAENFIREMKGVFETNFIDIPEEEVSVVDELTEAVESYKEQLEEQATSLDSANKELLEIKRKEIVDGIGEDLPQTQKIRLEKLSENVEADDIEEFRYKIEQLKEGYFDESSEQPLLSSLSEEVFGGTVIEEDDSTVSQYAKFLSKTVTK
tara:strand:- start:21701 stop:23932 length:2232 start_codon:yes stop_codon:yes gene_type:complete